MIIWILSKINIIPVENGEIPININPGDERIEDRIKIIREQPQANTDIPITIVPQIQADAPTAPIAISKTETQAPIALRTDRPAVEKIGTITHEIPTTVSGRFRRMIKKFRINYLNRFTHNWLFRYDRQDDYNTAVDDQTEIRRDPIDIDEPTAA